MFRRRLLRKNNDSGKKNKNNPIKKFLFSFLLAVIAYIGLINVEKSLLQDYEHCKILRAKSYIEENTEFTKENVKNYFYSDDIPVKLKTAKSIQSFDDIVGSITCVSLEKGEIISKTRLIAKTNILKEITHPVEVSFEASDLSQVVGGIIRKGDIINISVVNSLNKTNMEVLNSAYVEKVFDTSGHRIDKTQKEASAVILNVMIDSSDVKDFNEKITMGEVRVSKIGKMIQ